MKILFYLSLLLSYCFVSCATDEETESVYSCNKEVDQWTKKNLREIRELTRKDWLRISEQSYQKAAYVAFRSEQKLDFWTDKLDEVLQLNWRKEEREHIKNIYEYLNENSNIFQNKCSDEERRKFDIFVYKWADKAVKELGWSQNLIANMVATGYSISDTKGTLYLPQQIKTRQTRSETDCDCHYGNVLFVYCTPSSHYCSNKSCKEKIRSCGAFWTETCDGLCD